MGTIIEIRPGVEVRRRTPVLEGTEVVLSFEKDGISGDAGCHPYSALAKVDYDSFTIEVLSLFRTVKECMGLDGWMEQEKRCLGVRPRLTRYDIHGDSLYMPTDHSTQTRHGQYGRTDQ